MEGLKSKNKNIKGSGSPKSSKFLLVQTYYSVFIRTIKFLVAPTIVLSKQKYNSKFQKLETVRTLKIQ